MANFNIKEIKINFFVFANRSASFLFNYLSLHVCHDAKGPKFPVEKSCFQRHAQLSFKAYGPVRQVASRQGRWS